MKKKLIIALASVGAVLLSAATVTSIVLPVTYQVDSALVKKNPDYSVRKVEGTKYTTVAKYDANGNISDEDFKVLAFTDLHLDHYKDCGNVAINMMVRNVVDVKPDMVVLLGDCITSALNDRRAHQLAKTFEQLGVYWTYTLGNHEHDNNFSITRPQMMKIFDSYKHCLVDSKVKTVDGEKVWGYSNDVINILGSDNKIRQSIYTIDGGQKMTSEDKVKYDAEYIDKGTEEYDYIKPSQIKWYEATVKDIDSINGSKVKSTMYTHIPLKQYKIGYQEITGEAEEYTTDKDGNKTGVVHPFANYTLPLVKDEDNVLYYGKRREGICCSGHDSGMFDKIKELGSTQAVFAGHDHVNNFVMKYQGIILGYCEPSGYSSYNAISKKIEQEDGTKKSLEDKLIQGCSVYTFDKTGGITFESRINWDNYSDQNEKIMKVVRK